MSFLAEDPIFLWSGPPCRGEYRIFQGWGSRNMKLLILYSLKCLKCPEAICFICRNELYLMPEGIVSLTRSQMCHLPEEMKKCVDCRRRENMTGGWLSKLNPPSSAPGTPGSKPSRSSLLEDRLTTSLVIIICGTNLLYYNIYLFIFCYLTKIHTVDFRKSLKSRTFNFCYFREHVKKFHNRRKHPLGGGAIGRPLSASFFWEAWSFEKNNWMAVANSYFIFTCTRPICRPYYYLIFYSI